MNRPEGGSVFMILLLALVTSQNQPQRDCCPWCPAEVLVKNNCSKFRCVSCEPCPDGTNQDELMFIPLGKKRTCLRCRTCATGSGLKMKAPCSGSSNTVCEADEGHFCLRLLEDSSCGASQRHRRCLPGEYIRKPGGPFADTECGTCANGSFSNGTLSFCQLHTQCQKLSRVTVAEGTSESDAVCGEKILVLGLGLGFLGLVLLGLGLGLYCYIKKRRKTVLERLNAEEKRRNAEEKRRNAEEKRLIADIKRWNADRDRWIALKEILNAEVERENTDVERENTEVERENTEVERENTVL